MEVHGRLYDGVSSARKSASVRALPGEIELVIEGEPRRFPRASVNVRERVGNSPRVLEFPGGLRFETNDNDGIDKHFAARTGLGLVHWLESNWGIVVGATVG